MPVGPWFADFLCRERKLVIELDGFSHDVQPERDKERDAWLKGAGYRVLHFANADVLGNAEGVVDAIRQHLDPGGSAPTPDPSRLREGN